MWPQVQILASTPYVIWVCCGFTFLLQQVFLQELWFSLLQHSQFDLEHMTHLNELWRTPNCFMGKQITFFPSVLLTALNAQIRVADRPMTKQGLTGMKTAAGRGENINLLNESFKRQYPHINYPNWSPYISIKNKLREFDKRSKHFPSGDYFISSPNLFSCWLCFDIVWEKIDVCHILGLKRVNRLGVVPILKAVEEVQYFSFK